MKKTSTKFFKKPRLTEHHRRYRVHGGTNDKFNISMVYGYKHEAWHFIFHHYKINVICALLNEYLLDNYTVEVLCLQENVPIEENINIDGFLSKRDSKRQKRMLSIEKNWKILFNKKKESEIIKEINDIWIDPACYLKIIKKK